jgi:two-component system chemotaxis response regulator CheB/chemosensory pili system protein ChpB (putative protein-glutamate methylesterase)
MSETRVPIALLSQAGESGRHLREALAGAGTPIVYEAHAAHLDRDALEQSGARVIVVNLDADADAHLDEVYALLGDDRYNVIFNEAQVSSQLSGWEQARWARHLAAKILGSSNADPPRPAGAEPVPQRAVPAPVADERIVGNDFTIAPEVKAEALRADDVVGESVEQAVHASFEVAEPVVAEEIILSEPAYAAVGEIYDFNEIENLLAQPGPSSEGSHADAYRLDAKDHVTAYSTAAMPLLDLSEFDDAPSISVSVDEAGYEVPHASSFDLSSFEAPPAPVTGEVLGFADLDDFAGDAGFGESVIEADTADIPEITLKSELAESATASETTAAGSTLSELQLLDLDWADAPKAPDHAPAESTKAIPPSPPVGSAFSWTLEDIDDGAEIPAPVAPKVPAKPSEFGIEKISAAEYLAPKSPDKAGPGLDDSGLSLELIPLEEAVAPQQPERIVHESWLDPGAAKAQVAVKRIWVLGASIGGPEAVREFLTELPHDYPALFLLAQHMGAEFMGLMAQQLAKTTALTVRTPTHGERVGHGDIVVVPITHRLRVDAEGVILLDALGEPTSAHSPSIDQLLHDVADSFGANAGVVVFSGMAEDAAEGSRYLAGKGGKVYVQDPQTCVISSMVDGVLETGVVHFTGSPKELAEKVLGERRPAGKF